MNRPPTASESLRPSPAALPRSFIEELQAQQPPLKAWLRARFPWLAEVDDIAQEAVLRLWRRHMKADRPAINSPKAALFSVARNAVIDLARHRQVANTENVAEIDRLPVLDEGADVVQTVAARQELEFLAEAVRGLPTRGRQVITLTKIYGLSEREVAEQLGISENTVRTHIVRGMERCADYLRARGVVSRKR